MDKGVRTYRCWCGDSYSEQIDIIPSVTKTPTKETDHDTSSIERDDAQDSVQNREEVSVCAATASQAQDVSENLNTCQTQHKDKQAYNNAVALMESEDYDAAIEAFTKMNGFKDSTEQIETCKEGKYLNAKNLLANQSYGSFVL